MSAPWPRKPFLVAVVAVVALAMAPLGACGGEDARRAEGPGTPSNAEDAAGRAEAMGPGGTTAAAAETVAETARCEQGHELRIGSFERLEEVPRYETLVGERADRGCARAIPLLVDTRGADEAGYALIARDIKARYADLDAVTSSSQTPRAPSPTTGAP